jgi:NADH dehydrogenase FAD-containing subunit
MRVLGGTVTAVDAAARLVIADGRAIPYDTLVLATGKLYAIQSTRTE